MKKIHIEYCEKWNYKPEFDRVSKIISSINISLEIKGNINEPRSGAFEIYINDILVFSKLDCKRFPNESEIYSWFH